ncbi:hypothetical protein A3F07_04775 [candidate division WWE3 bacterium RIFCSPHIGHO2_12_FULL_38_15]|uniref:Peptidase C39-like domain-containing protein n=1 Tax=candidate division WWE3 bacterium RIFCSPHIGHO2_02_FULL_38_14 TaxID=1802620 RepID=A0A1F4V7Z2_UNCKA|nr:MAG: hypothetical protein A2793_00405 [candidate division WWE3 bacterium RIFCSPHIGHO2_01_FULL_38_45]OGC49553.1 MAG: hypothetical protein A3F07_04775 [candidate division WWE3 bacterium RIFCSPHIGHO2_12_FULL_38_15]OGC53308.1 MAG: hypothetical protein A3D91_02770 [candidate division WWE3 bacterium RIFCSPHIGHO2_02_FULL_38_14]HLB51820.1 C39 family peptidase [Patescibacteria group bacterium]
MYRILSLLLVLVVFLFVTVKVFYLTPSDLNEPKPLNNTITLSPTPAPSVTTSSDSTPVTLIKPAEQKTLKNDFHIFQTFNNCGPASLSMALSYFGIKASQKVIGDGLRPYQNPQGDNDDKSVTLNEMREKAKEYGLIPFHRPNGNINLIKYFIAYDIPIIAFTWTKPDEDIGHYRVVKGYDDNSNELIQDDSLQGKNLKFKYDDFNVLWHKFNYEYLVLVPKDKVAIAEAILGENKDESKAWKNAIDILTKFLEKNPGDVPARFSLSISYFYIGDYKKSIEQFEMVQSKLSKRALWYQIEPIQAYFELGDYNKVFEISDNILNKGNRAFSELYMLRGKIYLIKGELKNAKAEFEKAVFYNKNMEEAQEALRKSSSV